MTPRSTLIGLGLAAILLAGCNGDDDTATETTPADDTADGGEVADDAGAGDDLADDGATDDDAADDDGAASPPPASDAGPVLATAEHPASGHDGTVEIELRAGEVGDLLRVELTFTPRGIDDSERVGLADLLGPGGGNGMSARLIDPVNLLEYETVRNAVPHGQVAPAHDGQPTTLNFYFGAPVEPLETFDFLLDFMVGTSEWPGFVDVQLATS